MLNTTDWEGRGFTSKQGMKDFCIGQITKAAWKADGMDDAFASEKSRACEQVLSYPNSVREECIRMTIGLLTDPGTLANTVKLTKANQGIGPNPADVVDCIVGLQEALIRMKKQS